MEFDWQNPDYDAIWKERAERLAKLRAEPHLLPSVREFYKNNPVQFVNDWGVTFDPRNVEIGLPATVPFVLFPKQEELINWVFERWKSREDGVIPKSRDIGASWVAVSIAYCIFYFYAGTSIGFGSRKEEYVDKLGDPKSLFWKIRQFAMLLPQEFRPVGYEEKKHASYLKIVNPENGSTITGEAGDNIGRGNRTSIYFKDESAFYERPEGIEAALSQTSNCKIDLSSANGTDNPFYRKVISGRIPVFYFHWRDDPRKDDAWYKRQCLSLDPIIVAQEIDIDFDSSTTDSWIAGQLVQSAQNNGVADINPPTGMWVIGIDAAHMGNDESVLTFRRGRLTLPQKSYLKIDGTELAYRVEEEAKTLEKTGGKIGSIVIELDGPGVSCYDTLKRGRYAQLVIGIHTGAMLKDDRNFNLRAKLWRDGRDFLEEGDCSLPPCPELKAQLASVRFSYKDGKLLMESKKEYKKRTGKSPDRGDSWILTFAGRKSPKSWANITVQTVAAADLLGGY